jgi:hypothetical protein
MVIDRIPKSLEESMRDFNLLVQPEQVVQRVYPVIL